MLEKVDNGQLRNSQVDNACRMVCMV